MFEIIDTAVNVAPHLSRLSENGIRTIARYLDPLAPHSSKCIQPAEARAIREQGMNLVLVCEGWGDFAHGGISAAAGERDGEWCAKYASEIGASPAAAIYFAVDTDANYHQITKLVIPYFHSINRALAPLRRVGVYGSGAVCEAVKQAISSEDNTGLATFTWLAGSLGWRGSRAYLEKGGWALRQHLPTHIGGVFCDPNDSRGDFGASMPTPRS